MDRPFGTADQRKHRGWFRRYDHDRLKGTGPTKRCGRWLWCLIGVLLLVVALMVWLTHYRDRDTYPQLVGWPSEGERSETGTTTTVIVVSFLEVSEYSYPRLVSWEIQPEELERARSETDTTITVQALSHSCNLDRGGNTGVTETFDHVEVYETADTVTIETWLGPPQGEGFSSLCIGTGHGFFVEVRLNSPLGNRALIDPACELDRYAHLPECPDKDPPAPTLWIRPGY